MVSYLEDLVQPKGEELSIKDDLGAEASEGSVLGYRIMTQRGSDRSPEGGGHNLEKESVMDHAETSIDYDLGEVASRSFCDRYGIWAGQEEIYLSFGGSRSALSGCPRTRLGRVYRASL